MILAEIDNTLQYDEDVEPTDPLDVQHDDDDDQGDAIDDAMNMQEQGDLEM